MNTVVLIQGLLSLVPTALTTYAEIRSTLDATTQAEVDALIAQIKPLALTAEQQAVADLRAASQ